MTSVREHYELLAPHYSRLFGDFEAKLAEQQAWIAAAGARAGSERQPVAVDLGAGPGFQSIALARLGFRVIAIDFSERLLAELRSRARGLAVEAVAGDIRDVVRLAPEGVDVVACMGDTLAHLEREDDLTRVFDGAASRLRAAGRLLLTFRDGTVELRELDRFLPLVSRDDLIAACVLEYEPATVKVHDLVWTRDDAGWRFQKGVYRKLRLAPDAVTTRLERAGFTVERRPAPAGMVGLVATLASPRSGA